VIRLIAGAEVFEGDGFVRRGRGRPKSSAAKEQISVRPDPDVLAKLREAGPGWQSQINALPRQAPVIPLLGPEPCGRVAGRDRMRTPLVRNDEPEPHHGGEAPTEHG